MRRLTATALLFLAAAAPAAADAPPDWRPHVIAARAWAVQRQGDVGFAVRTERRAWSWRGSARYRSASLVKAMLLVAYLRRPDVRGRAAGGRTGTPRPDDPHLGQQCRERDPRARRPACTERAGAPRRHAELRPVPGPGGLAITAADQARLFCASTGSCPGATASTRCACCASRPRAALGDAAARPDGWRIALKGGWGRGVTRQVDNQAALLTNGRLRVAIAVLSGDNPSDAYGAATLKGVAKRLLRGLAGTIRGEVVGARQGLEARRAEQRRDQQQRDQHRVGHYEAGNSSFVHTTMTQPPGCSFPAIAGIIMAMADQAPDPAVRHRRHAGLHRRRRRRRLAPGVRGAARHPGRHRPVHRRRHDRPDVGAKTFEAVIGREPSPHELAQLVQRRLEHLPEAIAESKGYKVLPGVPNGCASSAATAICSG